MVANGRHGWIQVTNLILTGLMVLAAGMAGAGVFVADPMDGFVLPAFWIGIVAAMAWPAAVCVHLYRTGPHPARPEPAGEDGRL